MIIIIIIIIIIIVNIYYVSLEMFPLKIYVA